jgi:hypothetical protein
MKSKNIIAGLLRMLCLSAIIVVLSVQMMEVNAMAETKEKITVGETEEVVLFPWKIKMPARIDTGATRSCLDARDIRIDGGMVEFRLPGQYGGKLLRAPLKGRRNVRSAHGLTKRAVVEIEICIGSRRFLTTVNLADRSSMEHPFLIGRNILANGFIVDVSRSNMLPPACLDGTAK